MEKATKVKTRGLLFRAIWLIKHHLCKVYALQQPDRRKLDVISKNKP